MPAVAIKRVKFIVEVLTSFSWDEGVDSLTSDEILVAEVPSTPTLAPTSGPTTGASIIDVNISPVTLINGSPILSYHIEIDDGMGGEFVDLVGRTPYNLNLNFVKTSHIITGRLYRV